jgi:hypothetical protein
MEKTKNRIDSTLINSTFLTYRLLKGNQFRLDILNKFLALGDKNLKKLSVNHFPGLCRTSDSLWQGCRFLEEVGSITKKYRINASNDQANDQRVIPPKNPRETPWDFPEETRFFSLFEVRIHRPVKRKTTPVCAAWSMKPTGYPGDGLHEPVEGTVGA